MNRHSILLLAVLVVIGVGMGALVDWQHGRAPALGPAGGPAAQAQGSPAGGGLVINGMSLGAPAPAGASDAAAPAAAPAAQVPASDSAACP